MDRRFIVIGATVIALITTSGCGTDHRVAIDAPQVRTNVDPTGPLLLAQFDDGIGAVPEGSVAPLWTEPNAVAAPDGSAVFSVRRDDGDRLARIDPRTGELMSSWPLRGSLSVSAVAPKGRWVALTDHAAGYVNTSANAQASTELVVFEPRTGSAVHRSLFKGDIRPEAFSVDGKLVFALDDRGDHYRVQTIELATGDRSDTSDRDKTLPAEDMHGASVRGVMSADRTLLATLYRNPGDADEPAFVHVLDLEHGWSSCADLPSPFGTGPVGSDVIELTPTGTVVVANAPAARVAEIHIDEVHAPDTTPVTVEFRAGTIADAGAALESTPGFDHVIAVLAT